MDDVNDITGLELSRSRTCIEENGVPDCSSPGRNAVKGVVNGRASPPETVMWSFAAMA